jgi:polyisoprenyl-phosphate glycosyltransferase
MDLAIAVIVLGGVQLACLGIIGTYLGRMYEEMKGRPLFIVWEDTRPSGAAQELPLEQPTVQESLALLLQGRR